MYARVATVGGLLLLLVSPLQADGQRRVPSDRTVVPPTGIAATGVSPAALELRAGESRSVTVTGSGLDRLTGALVRRGGRSAPRVTVELGAPEEGQSRSVTITMPNPLGSLSNHDLTLVLQAQRTAIETPLELAAVAPELESWGFVASGNSVTGENNKVSL